MSEEETKAHVHLPKTIEYKECVRITLNQYREIMISKLPNKNMIPYFDTAVRNLPQSEVEYFKAEHMIKIAKHMTYNKRKIPERSDEEIRIYIAYHRFCNPECDFCNLNIGKVVMLCTKCCSMYYCSNKCRDNDTNHKEWCCNPLAKRDKSTRQFKPYKYVYMIYDKSEGKND